jgi:deazaflavin-dependent oxidoreductase (nitroreductase family)
MPHQPTGGSVGRNGWVTIPLQPGDLGAVHRTSWLRRLPVWRRIRPGSEEIGTMTDAKLAPNLPGWMQDHANRYLASGGTEGHMYRMTQPGRPEMIVPSLLLTTTGRKTGEKFVFPLFYGNAGNSYFVVASKGGAPQHPGWYRNILSNPEVEVQVGTAKVKARARTATGEERARLWEKSLEFWPPYADYQRKTEREIPVVVLDPVN